MVQGQVHNEQGVPLTGTQILISNNLDFTNTLAATTTNKDGEYLLAGIQPGRYFLRAVQPGFQSAIKAPVEVQSGKTTKLNVVLQPLGSIGNPNDPVNWDFKTVLRSSNGRRMIFREKENSNAGEPLKLPPITLSGLFGNTDRTQQPYRRNVAMELSSASPSDGDNFTFPSPSFSGIKSNFGFTEPIGTDTRYVFAGQINSGYDSLWKIKNQVDMKLSESQVLTMSIDYSRLAFNAPKVSTLLDPKQTLTQDAEFIGNHGRFQSLTFGMENYWRFWDPVTFVYGADMAVLKGEQSTRAFVVPNLQIVIQPTKNTSIRTAVTGKRLTENESVPLSQEEAVSLAQPFRLAQVNDQISIGKGMHYDASVARQLPLQTTLEVGAYSDRFSGDPLPLMASLKDNQGKNLNLPIYMAREAGNSSGMRVVLNHQFLEFIRSSISYVYGSGPSVQGYDVLITGEAIPQTRFAKDLFHSVTTRVDADFQKTNTRVSTALRWVFGSPLGPIDPFFDYDNLGTGNFRFTVRQVVPIPDLWGVSGKWEVLVDMRNLVKNGDPFLNLPQGKLYIQQNQRTIRFGISFRM